MALAVIQKANRYLIVQASAGKSPAQEGRPRAPPGGGSFRGGRGGGVSGGLDRPGSGRGGFAPRPGSGGQLVPILEMSGA